MSYGYEKRPPMPDRFVAGGIAEPKNQWPYKMLKEFRDPSSAGYTRTITRLTDSSIATLKGHSDTAFSTLLSAGTVATQNGWASEFNRYGYLLDVTATGASVERSKVGLPLNFTPRAFLDPEAPSFPGIIRIEDVIAAETTNVVASHGGGMNFGFSSENSVPPAGGVTPHPWIGFQTSWSNPDTAGEWKAVLRTAAPADIVSESLGVTSDEPHHFAIELDGVAKQVNWYVDDVLITSYTVDAQSDIYASNANFTEWIRWDTTTLTNTAVTRSLQLCDMSSLLTVTFYDLDET